MTEKITDLEKQKNLDKTDKKKKRKQRHKFDFFGLFIEILCQIVTSIFSFLYQLFVA